MGLCRLGAATQGLVTIWVAVWWSKKYSADDASITSLFFRRRRSRKGWESWQILKNGLLGYGDDKVRVNSVWEEGVYLVKFVSSEVCMDKGICKSRTSRSPRSAWMWAKKEWAIMVFVLNALTALEDSMSTEWVCHWQHRLVYCMVDSLRHSISSGRG